MVEYAGLMMPRLRYFASNQKKSGEDKKSEEKSNKNRQKQYEEHFYGESNRRRYFRYGRSFMFWGTIFGVSYHYYLLKKKKNY